MLHFLSFVLLVAPAAALDNGLARLPPMGWMSWGQFLCEVDCDAHPLSCINDVLLKTSADAMVMRGLARAGYNTIHIDDCWSEMQRDGANRLVANKTRFPDGMAALADYMHDRGLRLGIYSDVGRLTCAKYPGSFDHEDVDAQTFADWRLDYVKYDGCNIDPPKARAHYQQFAKSLNATGKPITYSCEWPLYDKEPNYTAIASTCNVIRNYRDVGRDDYGSIVDIIQHYVDNQKQFIAVSGPGNFLDPDMLIIGNKISLAESRTQMAIWSAWSAPLIMGNDVRTLSGQAQMILQNKDVIAVDQDPLGILAKMVKSIGSVYCFVKPMTPREGDGYSYALVFWNRGESRVTFEVTLKSLGATNAAGYMLKDLWADKQLGVRHSADTISLEIDPHDSAMLKATIIAI